MKKRIIIMLSIIIFMLVAYASFSYALFTKSEKQEGINQITTYNCLDISINGEEELNLTNAYPIKDEEGILQTPYTFTITNNCDKYVGVDVGIELQDSNTLSDEKLKVSLNKKYEEPLGTILSSHRTYYTENEQQVLDTKYILFHDGINANNKANYEYRMWIDYNAGDEIVGSIFKGKVIATATIRTEEPHGWSNSESGMLLYALKRDNEIKEPLTIPGEEISLSDESVLASTPDDYGTSYYFRGNVENNYLVFANKCWRIVRITGDGSIKLTLYNYSGTSCTATGDTLAYARLSNDEYKSKFNENYNNNAYIGFMYGTPGSATYEQEHENIHDSTILSYLKEWYDFSFTEKEKNMLADVIWCNDKRLSNNLELNPDLLNNPNNLGYSKNITYYKLMERIESNLPELACGDAIIDNKISKFTAQDTDYGNGALNGYKIGLLTADEIFFVGLKKYESNKSVFLYKNASGSTWRTMTPYCFRTAQVSRTIYISASTESGPGDVNGRDGVRPAIALISNIKISRGDGTISNPYVIDEN